MRNVELAYVWGSVTISVFVAFRVDRSVLPRLVVEAHVGWSSPPWWPEERVYTRDGVEVWIRNSEAPRSPCKQASRVSGWSNWFLHPMLVNGLGLGRFQHEFERALELDQILPILRQIGCREVGQST